MGYFTGMISAILGAIAMVIGPTLDLTTLPFQILFALIGGTRFEFRRFSRRRT